MAENKKGHWYTDKAGNHYFVEEGQSPKEGWEASKRRKMISGGKYMADEGDGSEPREMSRDEYDEYEADESEFDETVDDDFGFDEDYEEDIEDEIFDFIRENNNMNDEEIENKIADINEMNISLDEKKQMLRDEFGISTDDADYIANHFFDESEGEKDNRVLREKSLIEDNTWPDDEPRPLEGDTIEVHGKRYQVTKDTGEGLMVVDPETGKEEGFNNQYLKENDMRIVDMFSGGGEKDFKELETEDDNFGDFEKLLKDTGFAVDKDLLRKISELPQKDKDLLLKRLMQEHYVPGYGKNKARIQKTLDELKGSEGHNNDDGRVEDQVIRELRKDGKSEDEINEILKDRATLDHWADVYRKAGRIKEDSKGIHRVRELNTKEFGEK